MENFKKRLIEFARTQYDMGQNRFEEYCGINTGTINSIKVKGPSADIISKISHKCPELNLNWLFRGEDGGDMVLTEKTVSPSSAPAVNVGVVHTVNIGNWDNLVDSLALALKNYQNKQ